MTDLSTDLRLVARFAQKIGEALASEVPGTRGPEGSYITQHLVTEDQARALARVIFEMIHEAHVNP